MTLEARSDFPHPNETLPFEVPEGGDPVKVFKRMLEAVPGGISSYGGNPSVTWTGVNKIFRPQGWVPINLAEHTLGDLIAGRATGCYEVNNREKGGSSETIILLLGGEEIYRVEKFRPTVRQKLPGPTSKPSF